MIFGTVCDEAMGNDLRVTVVATGLGRAASKKQAPPLTVIKTGTHDALMHAHANAHHDYQHLDTPAVWRTEGGNTARAVALEEPSVDRFDIPAFLRTHSSRFLREEWNAHCRYKRRFNWP